MVTYVIQLILVNCCLVYRERSLNTTSLSATINQLNPATQYSFTVVAVSNEEMLSDTAQITVKTQDEG